MYHLIAKKDAASMELLSRVKDFLKQKKLDFVEGLPQESTSDVILAIGDDNLILNVFRELRKREVPVLGIASVQSFLAQSDSNNFMNHIMLINKGRFDIFRRARIVASINGKKFGALNDIGIFSSKSASLIRFNLNINNELLWKDSADGLIVSTPTGSTGYSYSAHGPIILDEPAVLSITSISSIEKKPPMIIPNSSVLQVDGIHADAPVVIMDGDERVLLKNDSIVIEKSKYDALFVQFSKEYAIEDKLKKRTSVVKREKTKNLPASAKLVYQTLSYEGDLTQKELIGLTFLPERTVRHALEILLKEGLITQQPYLNDARQTVYGV